MTSRPKLYENATLSLQGLLLLIKIDTVKNWPSAKQIVTKNTPVLELICNIFLSWDSGLCGIWV